MKENEEKKKKKMNHDNEKQRKKKKIYKEDNYTKRKRQTGEWNVIENYHTKNKKERGIEIVTTEVREGEKGKAKKREGKERDGGS